jgi:hypothetical protein
MVTKNRRTREGNFQKILPVQQEYYKVPPETFGKKFMIDNVLLEIQLQISKTINRIL